MEPICTGLIEYEYETQRCQKDDYLTDGVTLGLPVPAIETGVCVFILEVINSLNAVQTCTESRVKYLKLGRHKSWYQEMQLFLLIQ